MSARSSLLSLSLCGSFRPSIACNGNDDDPLCTCPMRGVHTYHTCVSAYVCKKDALAYETQDILVLLRDPAVGACSLHLGAAAGVCLRVRARMYVCVCALPPGRTVGVETIGGRCVELDAEEISHVSRAVAVVLSATRSSVSVRDELPARLFTCPVFLPWFSRFTREISLGRESREGSGISGISICFASRPVLLSWVPIERSRVRLLDVDEETVRSVGFCNGTFRSTSRAVYARRRCRANNTTRLPAHRNAGYCNGRRY